jgi:hypothetical protein
LHKRLIVGTSCAAPFNRLPLLAADDLLDVVAAGLRRVGRQAARAHALGILAPLSRLAGGQRVHRRVQRVTDLQTWSRRHRRKARMHHRIVKGPRSVATSAVVASAAAVASAVVTLAAVVAPGAASAAPGAGPAANRSWAPAGQASVHPGVMTNTAGGGQCTSNFIFANATDVFIGQAAHCAGTGAPTETSGCTAGTKPLGTPVTITGASKPGTLVYSSWITMVQRHEQDANTCAFNDFALVRVDPADLGKVNPSVPFFGGPTGISTSPTLLGDRVLTFGNSPLRAGVSALSPKEGISLGDDGDGWSHTCYTVSPGIPGDSGSAVLTNDGKALGVLTSLAVAPLAGSNGVGDLSRELAYLNAHGGLGVVTLALGTESFHPLVP